MHPLPPPKKKKKLITPLYISPNFPPNFLSVMEVTISQMVQIPMPFSKICTGWEKYDVLGVLIYISVRYFSNYENYNNGYYTHFLGVRRQ